VVVVVGGREKRSAVAVLYSRNRRMMTIDPLLQGRHFLESSMLRDERICDSPGTGKEGRASVEK